MKIEIGTNAEYRSNHGPWIWQGHVERITWKFIYVRWTRSNSPVTGGPVVESDSHLGCYNRKGGDLCGLGNITFATA